jgi:hypothetical protein
MEFLAKIEALVDKALMALLALLAKLVPPKVKVLWEKLCALPGRVKLRLLALLPVVREKALALRKILAGIDFRAKLLESWALARSRYEQQKKSPAGQMKLVLLSPFLLLGQWLQGLTAGQSLLLMGFTAASLLAGINIVFSGHRVARGIQESSTRAPASAGEAEQDEYQRPGYYKKNLRHYGLTSLRLPVYIPEVNQIKSVDVDFVATLSTREARMLLEKKEFQLRDFLLLEIEPSVASFPLEEEGREILRHKLEIELNNFLALEGNGAHVEELQITYILAN